MSTFIHPPRSTSPSTSTVTGQANPRHRKVILVCEKCEKIISFYIYSYDSRIVDRNIKTLCKECYKLKKLKE